MLVLPISRYGDRLPVKVETSAIGKTVQLITREDLAQTSEKWKQVYIGMVLSK